MSIGGLKTHLRSFFSSESFLLNASGGNTKFSLFVCIGEE